MMWKSIGCAVQGRGHDKNGTLCQDAVRCQSLGAVHTIVLADGAGSARLSRYGAEAVVHSVGQLLAEKFHVFIDSSDGVAVKQHILDAVLAELREEAELRACEMHDLAATLLAVAADNENFLAVHIGDGVIGCYGTDGLKTLSVPDNGEFANATTFVTSRDALQRMRIYKGSIVRIAGFILMSDGTEQSLYHKRERTIVPAVVRLMHLTCLIAREQFLPQLTHAFETVVAMQTQDDCSIALMARCSRALPPLRELSTAQRQELFSNGSIPIGARLRLCRRLHIRLTPRQVARALHGNHAPSRKAAERIVKIATITRKKVHDRIT